MVSKIDYLEYMKKLMTYKFKIDRLHGDMVTRSEEIKIVLAKDWFSAVKQLNIMVCDKIQLVEKR